MEAASGRAEFVTGVVASGRPNLQLHEHLPPIIEVRVKKGKHITDAVSLVFAKETRPCYATQCRKDNMPK